MTLPPWKWAVRPGAGWWGCLGAQPPHLQAISNDGGMLDAPAGFWTRGTGASGRARGAAGLSFPVVPSCRTRALAGPPRTGLVPCTQGRHARGAAAGFRSRGPAAAHHFSWRVAYSVITSPMADRRSTPMATRLPFCHWTAEKPRNEPMAACATVSGQGAGWLLRRAASGGGCGATGGVPRSQHTAVRAPTEHLAGGLPAPTAPLGFQGS
jgi:hypothetical protein